MTGSVASMLRQGEPHSLADKAYQLLVRKIIRVELAPGTVLVEKSLIEQLGIGRTPIREALQRLAIEGLVTHLANRGMLVSEVSATTVQEVYEFRLLVDGYAARLAATRATPKQIEEMASLQKELVEATEENDIDRYVLLDRRFYEVLASASHNRLLAEAIPRIFNLHLRLWFVISKKLGSWHPIAQAHEEMTKSVVDGLLRRDADAAELAMRIYISERQEDFRNMI